MRIGNGAYKQHQIEIYGELLDSIYLYNKYGAPISHDLWLNVTRLVDWVCDHWDAPDEGIWEVRGGRQELFYSRLMCWVAVDRGLRLADKRSFPAGRARWLHVRDDLFDPATGRVDMHRLRPVGRLCGNLYSHIHDIFELKRPSENYRG